MSGIGEERTLAIHRLSSGFLPSAGVQLTRYTVPTMVSYFGYFLLIAGALMFLITWFDTSRKSLPLIFAATMMIMGGLAILQFIGTETPAS
jgi:hypothetical protein